MISRTGPSRPIGPRQVLPAAASCIGFVLCPWPVALAADPEFQDFFFDVCANPTGTLAVRCGETDGGLGNLSGDSESSLNPSQTLSSPSVSVAAASARTEQVRERAERARTTDDEATVDLGPFSLLLNARHSEDDRTREVGVDNERGYEAAVSALELGVDYRAGEHAVIGSWLSFERSDLDFVQELPGNNFTPLRNAGSIEHQSLGLNVFASFALGERGYFDLSGGYLDLDYDLERRSVFQESNRIVPQTNVETTGETGGSETWFAATWGYNAPFGAWTVGPYLGVTHTSTTVDGYDETDVTGSGLALTVDEVEQTSTAGTAGLRITRAISRETHVLVPQLRLEYVREFDTDEVASTVAFQLDADANRFGLLGDEPDDDYFNASLGIAGVFRNGWMPFLELQGRLGHEDLDRYRVVAGFRVEL